MKTITKDSLEEIRIELSEYRGYDLVGRRIYSSFNIASEMVPTRKGLTVRVEMLPGLIGALQEVKKKIDDEITING